MTRMELSAAERSARDVFTVSRLNREARAVLEGSFPLLWVEGEISNLARPKSGHLYFSLKDEAAQVRCAMFRMRNLNLRFRPENGMHVLIRARVGLYEQRGEFQLVAEHMEEAGDGALRRAFEALKRQLDAEGLFDASRKRPLPTHPRCIGVVTSPTGAAIRDILTVLRRRFPSIPVVVYPVAVQGAGAAEQIATAIAKADARQECDVLVVGRGGGSLEDLQAFNEEPVARAIAGCRLPVVSAVGHEIDFTIADFAADHRAPTPSAAAELLSPDRTEWLQRLSAVRDRLTGGIRNTLRHHGRSLAWMEKRLVHPGRRLTDIAQRLDDLELRLGRARDAFAREHAGRLGQLRARLQRHDPRERLAHLRHRVDALHGRLAAAEAGRLERAGHRLSSAGRALDAVSPLATLRRGYAIVTRDVDGAVVRGYDEVRPGDRVQARLGRGHIRCKVEETGDDG